MKTSVKKLFIPTPEGGIDEINLSEFAEKANTIDVDSFNKEKDNTERSFTEITKTLNDVNTRITNDEQVITQTIKNICENIGLNLYTKIDFNGTNHFDNCKTIKDCLLIIDALLPKEK